MRKLKGMSVIAISAPRCLRTLLPRRRLQAALPAGAGHNEAVPQLRRGAHRLAAQLGRRRTWPCRACPRRWRPWSPRVVPPPCCASPPEQWAPRTRRSRAAASRGPPLPVRARRRPCAWFAWRDVERGCGCVWRHPPLRAHARHWRVAPRARVRVHVDSTHTPPQDRDRSRWLASWDHA